MKSERTPEEKPWVSAGVAMLVALSFALVSCEKKESPTGPDNHNPPAGTAQVTGQVRDAAGQPIADAALHLVYVFTGESRATHLDQPSVTFFQSESPLMTECGGSVPIPDGVMVKLFWDRNGNGPDNSDQPPPLCDHPLECDDGPAGTVNIIEFAFNGLTSGLGPGMFYSDPGLVTQGDVLDPNRFFARIYCMDGNVLYTSNWVEPPSGVSDAVLHFDCDSSCNGAPAVPEWFLTQSYPNPAVDSITVPFGLQVTGEAVVLLSAVVERGTDTLFSGRMWSGGHEIDADLADRPNGLYYVRLVSGGYSAQHTLLRNITDYDRLRENDPAVWTANDGTFSLAAAAGVIIDRRDAQGESQGTAALARLKVVATKNGYAAADTTFEISSGSIIALNLTLHEL
ncbi:MAG: hypothetical protein NT025_07605 [bacterium]|nr:hypothetical protein [bacterium]